MSSHSPTVTTSEQPLPHPTNGTALPAAQADGLNDSALATSSRLPPARRGRRLPRFVVPLAIVVFLSAGAAVWAIFFRNTQARADLVTTKVEYRDLQVKIIE